ncbi:hypothetical protein CEW89_11915 [Celeribacter ethanolicus]|uniref:Porin domain-containing protein n=1 Tax=Celeribacter ethanolicus TaxID=1758178 RepID=A0A291GDI7_9RHOB|nr:porin [Celeribacter ethanolicus]ATG48208.1 hypothetical protein CEW89_11915 [Celeribacter ethanolicus]
MPDIQNSTREKMKNILLSSAAIALLAGAASAEVTWSGDAEIGYNDDYEDGFYWDAGLYINMSQELNNGWTASASLDIDLEDSSQGSTFKLGDVDSSDWVVSISNDMFGLSFGDVDTAYASFKGVSALYDNDFFAPMDEAADLQDFIDEQVDNGTLPALGAPSVDGGLLLTAEYGNYSAAASVVSVDGDTDETGQIALAADFGMFTAGLFYAENVIFYGLPYDDTIVDGIDDMTVLSLGASFGGADFTASVMDFAGETGYGLEVAYPVGPVTLGAYYASYDMPFYGSEEAYGVSVDYSDGPLTVAAYFEEDFVGAQEYAIEGQYDFGMGLVVTAGYIDGDDDGTLGALDGDDDYATYIVAEYDLGGGASFLASYADANSVAAESTDDIDTGIGGYELYSGATVSLSFSF